MSYRPTDIGGKLLDIATDGEVAVVREQYGRVVLDAGEGLAGSGQDASRDATQSSGRVAK